MEYASNGKGNLGVTLGAIGTGLSLLQNGMGLLGTVSNSNSGSSYVTKDEMNMMQELSAKDSEIALLKADQASEVKMTEVYKQAHNEIAALRDATNQTFKEVEAEIALNRREQDMWNANQSVVNSQISSAIAVNTNSIAAINNTLDQITMLKVPNSAVCPGWGPVTVSPTFAGTTVSTSNGTTTA